VYKYNISHSYTYIYKFILFSIQTRVLVTHGIHWLPHVDKIIVLVDGTISETGSYEELLEHDGAFAGFLRKYLTEHTEVESETEDEESRCLIIM